MGLHELGHDLILALDLRFEMLDLSVLGVFDRTDLAAIVEGEVGVLEQLTLPLIEECGVDLELVAEVRDRDALEEGALDDGDLLLGCTMAARLLVGHGGTSVQVMLTRTKPSSRFD